jgi:hypothetical protein
MGTGLQLLGRDAIMEGELYLGKDGFDRWLGEYGKRLESPEAIEMAREPFFFFKESWLWPMGLGQLDDPGQPKPAQRPDGEYSGWDGR